jgi:CrcB protein
VSAGRTLRLAILAGGIVGTALRAAVAEIVPGADGFPWATLGVNLAGAWLLGVVVGGGDPSEPIRRAFLGTGVLGSFTTFSTFAVEVVDLWDTPVTAGGYMMSSVVAGLGLAALGIRSGRRLSGRREVGR